MKKTIDKLQKLNPLVGKWRSEGAVPGTPPSSSITIKGTDTYEWVCAGAFLLHRVDVIMGDEHVEVVEMIGYDPDTDSYPMRSFDNQGTVSTMQSAVDENCVWKLTGAGMRSTLTISSDGKEMNAHWEQSPDGQTWMPWMKMHFTRIGT